MVHAHTVHLPLGALLTPCTMCGTGGLGVLSLACGQTVSLDATFVESETGLPLSPDIFHTFEFSFLGLQATSMSGPQPSLAVDRYAYFVVSEGTALAIDSTEDGLTRFTPSDTPPRPPPHGCGNLDGRTQRSDCSLQNKWKCPQSYTLGAADDPPGTRQAPHPQGAPPTPCTFPSVHC